MTLPAAATRRAPRTPGQSGKRTVLATFCLPPQVKAFLETVPNKSGLVSHLIENFMREQEEASTQENQ